MTPPRFIPAQVTTPAASDPDQRLIWNGLPVSGRISSGFAAYEPYREAQGWGSHNGVDITGPDICGQPIMAAYSGIVHYAFGDGVGGTEEGSLGTFVILRHEENGAVWFTAYAHMLMTPTVTIGQSVQQGQTIGMVGYSGAVNPPGPGGAHLHFVVMEGAGYVNRALDTFFDPETLTGAALITPPANQIAPVPMFAFNYVGKGPEWWMYDFELRLATTQPSPNLTTVYQGKQLSDEVWRIRVEDWL